MNKRINLILLLIFIILVILGCYTEGKYIPHKEINQNWIKRTMKTHKLQQKLIELWYSTWDSKIIIDWCKDIENKKYNARHCVALAAWVWISESSAWNKCYKNSCMGVMPNGKIKGYKNKKAMFKDWLIRYKKYWYKSHPKDLYWNNWKPWKNRYCLSEYSTKTIWWCPAWFKNSFKVYIQLL